MRKSPLQIVVSEEERRDLFHVERSSTSPNGLAQRARMVLLFAAEVPIAEIARRTGTQRQVVRQWLTRFSERRVKGLSDLPRPGRKPVFSPLSRVACGQNCVRTT